MLIIQSIQSAVQKAIGLSQATRLWLTGTDTDDSSSDKPTKPYAQVDLVFACVNKLIAGIAGLPAILSTLDDRIVESGPVYDLLFSNPSMSWGCFLTSTIGHYALSRDVFWIFIDTEGTRPKEIMVVSGTQMKPVTHNRTAGGVLIGWEFRGRFGERASFDITEVHQWKNFNPYDKFHGLGPTSASKLSIDYSYAASLLNTSSLENAAEPGAILTAQGRLDDDQIRQLRSQFDARHKGAAKAKRTAILTGGMDIKTIAMKLRDMDIAKISQLGDIKLCSCFGVPPEVVGIKTEAQYAHGPAQRDFIFNTIIPLASLFGGELTTGIISKFHSRESRSVELQKSKSYSGSRFISLPRKAIYRKARHKASAADQKIFCWFDSDQHPTVQEAQQEIAEKVLKFTTSGVPLNDIIEAYDLPFEPTEHGKHWWVPMGQVPAAWTLAAGIEGITGPSLPEGGPDDDGKSAKRMIDQLKKDLRQLSESSEIEKTSDQRLLRIWRNWVTSWSGIERQYSSALRIFFIRQQRILTGKLKEALAENKAVKDTDNIIARVVFDLLAENNKLKVIHQTFFKRAAELGTRQSLVELTGMAGDQLDQTAAQAMQTNGVKSKLVISTTKIVKVNSTTQDMVADQLREGLTSGEGLDELTGRIKTALGSNRARALRIARTSTAGGVNTGRQEGMRSAGVKLKSWITSGDDDVRDSHRQAGSNYAKGIPLDQHFTVGGEMLMYPGDPAGSAGNIINCRCLHIAIAATGRTYDLDYYANIEFYNCSKLKD